MGEDENIALVNVKEAESGCGAPVSELYRQMSRQSPKVDIVHSYKCLAENQECHNTWLIRHISIVDYFRIMPCWP